MVKHVTQSNFNEEVLKEEGIVLVDFWATWCGPCKMIAPILEEVSTEIENVKIVKVDVDENPTVANEYGIQNIPTLKLFKNGEEIDTFIGFKPKDALKEAIAKHL